MMGRSIQPPEQTAINVALQTSGALIDTGWQRSFYAYFDAFLSAARSVPEIIQCCFGVDLGHPDMEQWFKNELPADERDRRHEFKKKFKPHYDRFRALPLTAILSSAVVSLRDGQDQWTVWGGIHRRLG